MSNYTFINGELYNTDELMHYGVLGMKWGKRKNYVTVNDARKNAKNAAKESIQKDKSSSKYVPIVKARHNVRKAVKKSIRNDKTRNKITKPDRSIVNKKNREDKFADRYKTYLSKELKKARKDLDKPYRQEIGINNHVDWPSKRKFIESEIDRVTRKQKSGQKLKDFYIDGKQYIRY